MSRGWSKEDIATIYESAPEGMKRQLEEEGLVERPQEENKEASPEGRKEKKQKRLKPKRKKYPHGKAGKHLGLVGAFSNLVDGLTYSMDEYFLNLPEEMEETAQAIREEQKKHGHRD